jgi:hypothetical protein
VVFDNLPQPFPNIQEILVFGMVLGFDFFIEAFHFAHETVPRLQERILLVQLQAQFKHLLHDCALSEVGNALVVYCKVIIVKNLTCQALNLIEIAPVGFG